MKAHLYVLPGAPAARFDDLRALAAHLLDAARDPATGEGRVVMASAGALTVGRPGEEDRSTPCAICKLIRDQAADTLGYAVLGEAADRLDGPAMVARLEQALAAEAIARADRFKAERVVGQPAQERAA